jgi:hypothetical protein
MPSISQCWQGIPDVSGFQVNKWPGRTQIIQIAIASPKPFLNQYALDFNGVWNKII